MIPWGQHGLPGGGPDRVAIETELQQLDRAVDAVADLLTSESVFQIVRGNSAKAASVLDAVGQGLDRRSRKSPCSRGPARR